MQTTRARLRVACAGAAVSAIDAMTAEMDYKKGSLLGRIEKAVADRVLPEVMGDWAKRVGDIAHTDDDPGPLPGKDETEELLLFANMCQRRSKISPPGRSKTSPLNVMRYAVLGGCPGSP